MIKKTVNSPLIKLVRSKVDQKTILIIEILCLICGSVGNGKAPIFTNIDSLLHHLSHTHNNHIMTKSYKLSLKHLQSVINYFTPKNGERKKNEKY